jgi:hypothetical protein
MNRQSQSQGGQSQSQSQSQAASGTDRDRHLPGQTRREPAAEPSRRDADFDEDVEYGWGPERQTPDEPYNTH